MRSTIDTAGLYLSDRMWADETDGESDSPTGYFALVTDVTDATFPELARTYDDPEVATVTVETFGRHVVITGDSQGFIYVTAYDTADEARAAYAALESQYAEWLGDDNDDETDAAIIAHDLAIGARDDI